MTAGNLRIVSAALVFCLCLMCAREGRAAAPDADLDSAIAIQEKARDDLNKKIQQYNATVKQKSRQAQSLLGRITDLRQDSKVAQQQIKLLELQGKKIERAMIELLWETAELSSQTDGLVAELRSRVLNMYKYGSREELNLLLSAENTHDAVSSAYLLSRLVRHNQGVVEDLLAKKAKLDQLKRDLEKNKALLSRQLGELNIQHEKYNASIDETSAALSAAQRERKKAEAAVKEVEQAQQEIGRTILALMQKKKNRQAGESPSEPAGAAETPAPSLARGSLLDWPLRGTVTASYGSRVHPVFKTKSFNSGIDIAAASGSPVRAAGPGEVLFEGWLRGFGQVVIIDHGGNISTVYANLASTRVKEREAVQPGTVIGTVGNTGVAEGFSLHFEVRVGDAAKNPMDYLKKT